ncbi:hypothetical protein [Streptomyces sp. MMG1121]|uniref:hypothetical protein n=1 Tax=Streptomyces sp. MMG1121 TaxID=1415544 RepID=UPI0006AD9C8B|nr:hypothetical protein [Streptomyces sp. MMG1121]KOV58045.1 hypothetical protein ADK64_36505 [Streptomyces sp. MMG1121]
MLKLGKTRRAVALASVTLASVGAIGLGGTADAETRATAPCGRSQEGKAETYNAYGMVAGTVTQIYDSCSKHVIAEWTWDSRYVKAFAARESVVDFGYGSEGLSGGVPDFSSESTATDAYNTGQLTWDYASGEGRSIYDASPTSWRAGADLDNSGCAAWTSQHYYATGYDTAGPYGGCNDTGNVRQIPWTQP